MNRLTTILIIFLILICGCDSKREVRSLIASPQNGPLVGDWQLVSGEPQLKDGKLRISFCDQSWSLYEAVSFQPEGYVVSDSSKCIYRLNETSSFDLDCSGKGSCYATFSYSIEGDNVEVQFVRGNNDGISDESLYEKYGMKSTVRLAKPKEVQPIKPADG